MTREDPTPMSLRDALDELTSELRVAGPDATARVSAAWPELVGSELAPHSRPGTLRDGVLTVTVDDPAWATPLRYLESEIVAGLTDRLGRGVVRGVRIQVARA
jgi:predicted nucleic acid-binding Zn ribbon protein